MKLPGRATLAANVVALGFLLFLYAGDLYDYTRAQTAEVSAMVKMPNIAFAGAVVVLTIALTVFALLTMAKNSPKDHRAYRLLPILAVVAMFVDLFVLSADTSMISPPDQTTLTLQMLARAATERSGTEAVASAERDIKDLLKELGAPPYLIRGKPAESYSLQYRENCDGPIEDAPGAQVGTFLYCVSKTKKEAWITVVALPYEARFGSPQVFSKDGRAMVAIVTPKIESSGEEGMLPFEMVEELDAGM